MYITKSMNIHHHQPMLMLFTFKPWNSLSALVFTHKQPWRVMATWYTGVTMLTHCMVCLCPLSTAKWETTVIFSDLRSNIAKMYFTNTILHSKPLLYNPFSPINFFLSACISCVILSFMRLVHWHNHKTCNTRHFGKFSVWSMLEKKELFVTGDLTFLINLCNDFSAECCFSIGLFISSC